MLARLIRVEKALLVFLLSAIVALSFLQVLMRQLFASGLLWADTLVRHLVLWVGFLGAALATAEGKHFAWETPSSERKNRFSIPTELIQLVTAAVTFLLFKASWDFLRDERASGATLFHLGSLDVPGWLLLSVIPLGFLLVFLHTVLRAFALRKSR
ncbi:MAG: TRAP transporter small permease subunit [Elusimicrobia bacterium]|nr:TRAP transporter small permease subunit [Elusimicrobiota bacterium]